jgi:TonB family protein
MLTAWISFRPARRRAERGASIRAAFHAAFLAALCACSGASGGTHFPTSFQPGPPLGAPPAPDTRQPGMEYLVEIAPHFTSAWNVFLEDLRLRLPPDHALNRPGLSARLALEIGPEGDLVAVRVAASSGNREFDETALEVARDGFPVVPPPAGWMSDDERVHVDWMFSRDARRAGPATARMRRFEWPLERALPRLLARGQVGDAARRVAAAAVKNGPAADEALVARFHKVCAAAVGQALASDDASHQVAGVAAAVAARLTGMAPALRRLALEAIDPAVRRVALRALGQLGDRAAVPLLRQVALGEGGRGCENSGAAAAALFQLGQDGEVRAAAIARLRSSSELERWSALGVMTQVPVPEAALDLVGVLRGNGGVARAERITAATALGAVAGQDGDAGRAALAALTECLDVADGAQRAACAQAIAGAAAAGALSRPAFNRLVGLLRDPDEGVRAAATLAAARLDPDRFASAMSILRRERSEQVLVALAEGLAIVPGDRAVARLARLSTGTSPAVRLAAARALAARREPRAAEILAGLAAHRDPALRMVAVRVARRPDALRAALRDEQPEVGAAALAALVELEGRWRTLPDAAHLIAAHPPGSAERTLAARAWLAP